MVNQWEQADVLIDGKYPVLEFFELKQSKWVYLGIEALFVPLLMGLTWAALAFKTQSSR
jgi:hypothetical protein